MLTRSQRCFSPLLSPLSSRAALDVPCDDPTAMEIEQLSLLCFDFLVFTLLSLVLLGFWWSSSLVLGGFCCLCVGVSLSRWCLHGWGKSYCPPSGFSVMVSVLRLTCSVLLVEGSMILTDMARDSSSCWPLSGATSFN
jgi:hypothetical protein